MTISIRTSYLVNLINYLNFTLKGMSVLLLILGLNLFQGKTARFDPGCNEVKIAL